MSRLLWLLLVVLGLVLSPLRAWAAAIPALIAYDAPLRLLVTTRFETGPLLRNRTGESLQPQCPTCSNRQGGFLSGFGRAIRELFGP